MYYKIAERTYLRQLAIRLICHLFSESEYQTQLYSPCFEKEQFDSLKNNKFILITWMSVLNEQGFACS